jgi:hypothetical protein
MSNEILDEIRAVRDALAAEFNYDAQALSDALTRQSQLAGRETVRFPSKPPLDDEFFLSETVHGAFVSDASPQPAIMPN